MKLIKFENQTRPLQSTLKIYYCDSFLCRLRGLMFRTHLPADTGLLLVEAQDSRLSATIHMLFVIMNLGVIWINSRMVVVDSVMARPWRPAYIPHEPARYILEIHPSRMNEFKFGDHIDFSID
jgi:uncharacterized membrane protein (UPF0127 family)